MRTSADARRPSSLLQRIAPFLLISLVALPLLLRAQTRPVVIRVASGESIQHALDVAPEGGATIEIAPGMYREVIEISKPHIALRGSGRDATESVIVFDRSAGSSGGTLKSATVNVRAEDFRAENLTFANDWNRTHEQVREGSQALALLVVGDGAILRKVRLLGNQDTLYAGNPEARQYFEDCYIEGNVDFIFGDSRAFFERCELHSTNHKAGGYVTAHGRSEPEAKGAYVFSHCRLTAEPGQQRVYLGRPWRPYARVIFLECEMGDHILPAGWREWHPGETHRIETAYYAEYRSFGPGAHGKEREPHTHQLSEREAAEYSLEKFFGGWIVR